MVRITEGDVRRLIQIESTVHYKTPPPPSHPTFTTIRRPSKVLISAPHGAVTLRRNTTRQWHEEEDFTAGMALLLAKRTGASAIANVWQTEDSDPNYDFEANSPYKQMIRTMVAEEKIRWLIDLHGAKQDSDCMEEGQLVDLGTRRGKRSLNGANLEYLKRAIGVRIGGNNRVHENGFPALETERFMSVTAFCHHVLGIEAVQVEMHPKVRIPVTRQQMTQPLPHGHARVRVDRVMGMLQALADFIDYLHTRPCGTKD